MNMCEHIRQVSIYHDGELSPEDARRLEAHLAQCAACARELRQLRGLSFALADAAVPEAPAKVIERLHDTVAAAGEMAVVTLAKRLIAAAAAIFLICTAWMWGLFGGTESSAKTANSWEWVAVAPHAETASEAQQIAQWIVDDLSSGRPHD
jgi:anti-sigma factor RsiW